MDPNWFYSTIAQSASAVVGLVGGFLAARLLSQRSELDREAEILAPSVRNVIARVTSEAQSAQANLEMLNHLVSAYEQRVEEGRATESLNFADAPSFLPIQQCGD